MMDNIKLPALAAVAVSSGQFEIKMSFLTFCKHNLFHS